MVNKTSLMKLSVDHLSDIILDIYKENKDIKKQIDLKFASFEETPKKLISLIKKEISSIKRSKKYYYYESTKSLEEQLSRIKQQIKELVLPKSAKDAVKLMTAFIDLNSNIFSRVDDSYGNFGYIFREACVDLGEIYAKANPPQSEIVDLVFTHVMNNDYGIYDNLIFNMSDALKEPGLNQLKDKFLNEGEPNSFEVKSSLKEIADCLKDVDYYIELCKQDGNLKNHTILDIAQRLISAWREDDAIYYLNLFDLDERHTHESQYHSLKIQALELKGNYKDAQLERHIWFDKSLCEKTYNEILNHTQQEELKENFIKSAINKAFKYVYPTIGLSFLYEIQEFDEVAKFIKCRIDEFTGEEYYRLRPIASSLEKIDPLAATLIYRKLIEPILLKAKSKYYSYAAKDLVKCLSLSENISSWGDFQSHEVYFKEIQEDNKRKVSLWPQYDEALKKNKNVS